MLPRMSLIALAVLTVSEVKCMSLVEILDFSSFLEKTSVIDKPKIDGPVLVPKAGDGEGDEGADEGEEDASPDAWEQSGKFEGDLVLNSRQRRLIVEDVAEGLSRNGLKDITKRWPNNELIYYIQKEHFSSGQVQAIQDGLDDIARSSCVTTRPYKKGDPDAVVIVGNRRGCFSAVGYQSGYQVLNLSARHPLGRGCFRHGTVVHELLHSLGFYHMQSSPDRDDYIDVKWDNIIEAAKHNFRKYNTFSVSDFGVPYDYDSVLHYSKRAFSSNGRATLVPKKGGAQIGQRSGMSDGDSQKLNKMYCDKNSGSSFDDVKESHKKAALKKKQTTNKPFEGQGLGYYQGKSVIVKLPKLETLEIKEEDVEDVPIMDDYAQHIPKYQDEPTKSVDHRDSKINIENNGDEVFIDISKLVADIAINPNKPDGYFGISEPSRENNRDHASEDSGVTKNQSTYRAPSKISDYTLDTHNKRPSYYNDYGDFKGRDYSEKNTKAFDLGYAASPDQPTDYAYDDFPEKKSEDSYDKSKYSSSEDVSERPNEKSYNSHLTTENGDTKKAPVTIIYDDYIDYKNNKNTAANDLKYTDENFSNHYNPSGEKTEPHSEAFDLYSIPATVKDWWGT